MTTWTLEPGDLQWIADALDAKARDLRRWIAAHPDEPGSRAFMPEQAERAERLSAEAFVAIAAKPDPVRDTLTALYDVADDDTDVLDDLATRAGLIWTCPVTPWTNRAGEDCDECGRSEADAIAYAEAEGREIAEGRVPIFTDAPYVR